MNTLTNKIILICLNITLFLSLSTAGIRAPEISASSAYLIEVETGKVLHEKNAHAPIPPASLTKLMTMHMTWQFMEQNNLDIETIVPVSARADYRALPPRSSLMFLEEGQIVTIRELLLGLAVCSGNDAAIAIAELIAGSVSEFARLMTGEARRLGLEVTEFHDASGLSGKNMTTAKEYADFCTYYISRYPRALTEIHSQTELTYPLPRNYAPSEKNRHYPVRQENRNMLEGRLEGVDGLKTGYIEESGYNFALTAERENRRLLLVLLGGSGENTKDGVLKRAFDGISLLTWGFSSWTTLRPHLPESTPVRVWEGQKREVQVQYSPSATITVQTDESRAMNWHFQYNKNITAPVSEGELLGIWQQKDSRGNLLQTGQITAAEDVLPANIFVRWWHRLILWFKSNEKQGHSESRVTTPTRADRARRAIL